MTEHIHSFQVSFGLMNYGKRMTLFLIYKSRERCELSTLYDFIW